MQLAMLFFTSLSLLIDSQSRIFEVRELMEIEPSGYCSSESENINLSRVYFIENEYIYDELERYPTVRIVGERIEFIGSEGEVIPINISDYICENIDCEDGPMDLLTKFSIYNNDFYVYYRESYQNRIYTQGMLAVGDGYLENFCAGRGGFESAH